jgi:phage-related protein
MKATTTTNESKAMTTFVITHDGQTAWQWDNPKNRINLADVSVSTDEWKERMEEAGMKIVDDRNQPAGNVFD